MDGLQQDVIARTTSGVLELDLEDRLEQQGEDHRQHEEGDKPVNVHAEDRRGSLWKFHVDGLDGRSSKERLFERVE